jgi:hypothetical protein
LAGDPTRTVQRTAGKDAHLGVFIADLAAKNGLNFGFDHTFGYAWSRTLHGASTHAA